MAATMSVLIQKRRCESVVTNNSFLPMYRPIKKSPAVCRKRPAPIAQNRLAFCPRVTLPAMKFQKLPALVYSATS